MSIKTDKITIVRLMLTLALLLGLASCNKIKSGLGQGKSKATGWDVKSTKKSEQDFGPGLVFIEGGTFTMGKVQDDVMRDWNNAPTQQHVQSFYMDETEVTNGMYMEYLTWLKKVFPPQQENYKYIYEGALPDTLVWRNRLGYSETMVNNYLRHPSYANYPVVGVNWIQAVEFSKWRTERVNEAILEKNGYLKKDAKTRDVTATNSFNTETYFNSPTLAYGGDEKIVLKGKKGAASKGAKSGKDGKVIEPKNIYIQRTSGLLLPEYRLPTEAEWEYAASSDIGQREFNSYKGQKKYPWSGQYTRSGKIGVKGDQLANFKQGNGDYGGIAGWSDDGADITNEVKKYPANDFGLYDMAGNVAEWVADIYRPIIDNEYNDFNYFRGNQYTKNKKGTDGKSEVSTDKNIEYHVLKNGKIISKTLPGQLVQVPVDDKETYLRQNFDKSYNLNYRDGDQSSTKDYRFVPSELSKNPKSMYNSPKHNIALDSLGNFIKKYDQSNKRTSLISDNVRVYKGGSWRDRAYWLDPAQRRFFPEDMATDYIGFRCAMSRLGSKSKVKKKAKK